ncbi:MAG: flagellar hook-associated protein FlgK, partial [Eubacterium sp.]|nr:flagellar hook-associated protein FlgK [Eubacterium sp.]
MGNLMTSFNAGVSGLHSAQASLTVTAHNLANASTTGYTRQQVLVADSYYQTSYGSHDNALQIGTGTTISLTRQIRNGFLDGQYRVQLGRQQFYEANSKAAMEIEDMLGELHGEEFKTSINDLWGALSSLATHADDIVYKDQLVMVASQFIEKAKVLQEELDTYQTSLNTEVKNQVDAINDIVGQIRELNKQIQKYEATGESANDYRDKRNECLDELSQYITFESSEQVDGTIMIYSEGGYLLDAVNQYYLTTAYESDTSKLLKPIWTTGENYFRYDSLEYSSSNNTDVGGLRGIMVARGNYAASYINVPQKPEESDFKTGGVLDTDAYNRAVSQFNDDLEVYNKTIGASVVMTIQSELDTLVHGIVTSVNNALCPNKEIQIEVEDRDAAGNVTGTHMETIYVLDEEKALIGDDANRTMGTELFSRRGIERYTEEDVTVLNENGTTSVQKVYRYNEEDTTNVYTMYTIGQLITNPVVARDSSTLPTMYSDAHEGKDGYANNELLAIAQSFEEKIGTLNPNSLTTYDIKHFYDGIVSELGIQGSIWNGIIENQATTVHTLETERQNVMGVSSDEELSNL